MKRIESLLKIAGMKFEFQNLEIRFHKRKVCYWSLKSLSVNVVYKIIEKLNPSLKQKKDYNDKIFLFTLRFIGFKLY